MNNSKSRLEYAVAPYNFVSLPNKRIVRYDNLTNIPGHNLLGRDKNGNKLLSGTIDYKIKAESPVIVASGKELDGGEGASKLKEFFKNFNGKYAIPGSTLKGLIRGNASILGLGGVDGYISDDLFLYRTFADNSKKLREEYKARVGLKEEKNSNGASYSVLENVKAGFIYKKNKDEFVIIPAKEIKGRTYFKVNEGKIKKLDIQNVSINYLSRGRNEYKPYCSKVSFETGFDKGSAYIKDIKRSGMLKNYGYMLCSGYMNGKKTHYIINDKDSNNSQIDIMLDKDEVRAYEEDLGRKKEKSYFYKLPSDIGMTNGKPVFYARYNQRTYFGFTPYLRIYYDNKVLNGVEDDLKDKELIDYPKALFGFIFDNDKNKKSSGYKSRVGFEDAEAIGNPKVENETLVVLGAPKPTCFPQYLKQPFGNNKNKLMSFNDKDFKIRGIKQYWFKSSLDPQRSGKFKVDIKIKPLAKGSSFKGKIHFNNLYEDELGLLLWSLKLNDNCCHNIGLAKPYGYGRISIEDIELKIDDIEKKYTEFTLNTKKNEDVQKYIEKYKEFVKLNYINGREVEELDNIQEFLCIKSTLMTAEQTRYMHLSDRKKGLGNEFSERLVLPEILDLDPSDRVFRPRLIKEEEAAENLKGIKKETEAAIGILSGQKQTIRLGSGEVEEPKVDSPLATEEYMLKAFSKNSNINKFSRNEGKKKKNKR